MIEAVPYDPSLLKGVVALYNATVKPVVHCAATNARELGTEFAESLDEQVRGGRQTEAIFVALDGGAVVGFVHCAIGAPGDHLEGTMGIIRFLAYSAGRRAAGQLLIDVSHDYFARHGMSSVIAFGHEHTYPFYCCSSAYLSDRMGHIEALLRANEYRRFTGEVIMDWPSFTAVRPAPVPATGVRITVRHPRNKGRLPGIHLRAMRGKREVGQCICVSAADFSNGRTSHQRIYVMWLGVDEKRQGRGMGKYLLSRALYEARKIGYTDATITTAFLNYRGAVFYTNFGFRIVDWTYGLKREIAGRDTSGPHTRTQ
jgi:GNAT superfamily N-acetyltransferase